MIKVINETGATNDTRILNSKGEDITGDLCISKLHIEFPFNEGVKVVLKCIPSEINLCGDLLSTLERDKNE